MMAHFDEGTLQAYLDDEVGVRTEIDAHIHTCAACAAELDRLRAASQLFATAVRSADVNAPVDAAAAAIERSRQPEVVAPRRPLIRLPLARAAMFLIASAAIASAAIPGSPVRAWISGALRSVGVLPRIEKPAAPVVSEPRPSADGVEPGNDAAALSIQPVEGRVLVILTDVAPEARVRVRVVDTDRVLVQASGEAARARFKTGPGRVELIGVGKGDVVVDVPASALDARVEADGRVLFEKVR